MKKLLSIVIAIIAIITMTVPAMAAETVDTNVTVGTNSTAPYMIALTMTPDDTVGDGVQVNPEFAKPNADGTFPPTGTGSEAWDGWRMVKFYVEVGHINGIENIDNVAIDVNYPATFSNPHDAVLFGSRAGMLKFEINVNRASEGSWEAQIVNPYPAYYPGNVPATMPGLSVNELVYNTSSDWVDENADDIQDADDSPWIPFLSEWGTARVKYATGYADTADDLYQTAQAIVLEIKGWMWFHQPGVLYTVSAKAATEGGATSAVLTDGSKFLNYNRVIGLYTDFDSVEFLDVQVGGISWMEGDRELTTSNKTTIWNNGNASAEVLVDSTKMVKLIAGDTWDGTYEDDITTSLYYNSLAKTIETFDAKLYFCDALGNVKQLGIIPEYFASDAPVVICNDLSQTGEIGETGAVLLQACRPAKIEFSVHPELGQSQESGDYKGFLTLSVAPYSGSQNPEP